MSVRIYHNPRCSKSRQALEIIERSGEKPEIVEYMSNPISESELKNVLGLLKMRPRDILRKKEKEYQENNLDDEALKDGEIISFIIRHPRLLERPIVVKGKKAVVARPPEKVREIL